MKRLFAAATLVAAMVSAASAADYGKVTGQVVLDGAAPKVALKVKKGDAAVKDPAVCAKDDVPSDDLIVNPENKGISDVFVYIKKVDAAKVHPDLKKSKDAEVVFDQKGCRFVPHTLVVRQDQVVVVKSDDAIQHNTHTYSIRNQGQNFIVGASDRVGVKMPKFSQTESLPFQVKCDIHPWMSAWWLVVDHPYATTTDKDGKFTLDKLPVGEHDIVIWQEAAGYIEKKITVKVTANGTTDLKVIKAPVSKFKL